MPVVRRLVGDAVDVNINNRTTTRTQQHTTRTSSVAVLVQARLNSIDPRKYRLAQNMSKAAQIEEQHGDELRQLYQEAPTAWRLRKKLLARQPPLDITDGVLKVWIEKYSKGGGSSGISRSTAADAQVSAASASAASSGPAPKRAKSVAAPSASASGASAAVPAEVTVANASQLEEMYGATLRQEQYNKLSIRKLSQALLTFTPPVHATDQVCKTWIEKYRIFGDEARIDSVEALETQYGEAIRACPREQRKTAIFAS